MQASLTLNQRSFAGFYTVWAALRHRENDLLWPQWPNNRRVATADF